MEQFGFWMAEEFDRLLNKPVPLFPVELGYSERLVKLNHELKDPSELVIPEYYSERERITLQYGIERARKPGSSGKLQYANDVYSLENLALSDLFSVNLNCSANTIPPQFQVAVL